MDITLKNIHVNERMSEETYCFDATVYLNGKRVFAVSNHGHGGENRYHEVKGGVANVYDKVAEIDAELGKEKCPPPYESLDNCLEIVIGDLVSQWLTDKDIKKMLRKIAYVKNGQIYTLPAKFKPVAEHLEGVQKASWWKEDYVLLNTLPIEEVRGYYEKNLTL